MIKRRSSNYLLDITPTSNTSKRSKGNGQLEKDFDAYLVNNVARPLENS